MKKMLLVSPILLLLGLNFAHGEEVQQTSAAQKTTASQSEVVAKPSRVKISFETHQTEYNGFRAERNSLYDYEKIKVRKEELTVGYAFNPLLTANVIVPYVHKSANAKSVVGPIDLDSSGLGDVVLRADQVLPVTMKDIFVVSLGVSLPTGGIDYKEKNAPQQNQPYVTQIGSGTYDGLISTVYMR